MTAAKSFIEITKSRPIQRDEMIQSLLDLGYERSSMVIEQGTYSVKGSVVDVFPINQNQPIRCDFFGDGIDRLTSFRVENQRSIRDIESTQINSVDDSFVKRLTVDFRVLDSELMSNIREGDYVVHERYGIGVFSGFIRLVVSEKEGEYVFIQFKGSDKLYMPLDQIPLLHKYVGSEGNPRLNGLYDGRWSKVRQKAHRELQALAEDIYQLYKARQQVRGFSFAPDSDEQLAFELACPFKETEDQLAAIRDIKRDMESSRPMDRLLCGDVGFGKTEVIFRAALKAVLSLKQVMILVPTTILAQQHYETFTKRCKGIDIHIACMSRLKSVQQNKAVAKGVANHDVDIVIGTHRLLQSDIRFNDLGLIVIDEEQRFGVTHKEKIQSMATHVDVLTTTATPIPRTLYMSLTGAKAVSKLNTPPPGRLPIHTVVSEYSTDLIAQAIQSELARGGQVYFLHNHVKELDQMRSVLESTVPDCRVHCAHGQMSAAELDDVMLTFYNHDCDVLLCTTIIENGLDVSNVNTVIINRADRLGLSQIHQIRGRVGRSNRQAYAYVLYPKEAALSDESKARLQVLKEAVGLGVGIGR